MRIPRLRIIFGAPRASKCPAGAELIIPHVQITSSGVQSTLSALESI